MTRSIWIICLLAAISLMPLSGAQATWNWDGVPISTAYDEQSLPGIVSDDAGGALVAWQDDRNIPYTYVYAQRVDRDGNTLWTFDGVRICTNSASQLNPVIAPDGSGGAIIAWMDSRGTSLDIYAQRVDASGNLLWGGNGVAICSATGSQQIPSITADGVGGAFIAWSDDRGASYDIYAQHVNSSGADQWATNGVAVCTAAGGQWFVEITADGIGEAIFTWEDDRSASTDIYAQRVNFLGSISWPTNGVPICTSGNDQTDVRIVSCSSGGAIIVWEDDRAGVSDDDIYAQQIDSPGNIQWASDGLAICTASWFQMNPSIASDGADGAIIAWTDPRNGSDGDIYAQHVNAYGNIQWPTDGLAVCTAADEQFSTETVPDGSGGAIISWVDGRNGNDDIYVGKVYATGSVGWTANGMWVCTAPGWQGQNKIATDGAGNVIISWTDSRSGMDIYTQRIESRYGYWGRPEPEITSAADNPTDQGGYVVVNWKASERDVLNMQTITHYSIWRATEPVAAAFALHTDRLFVDIAEIGPEFEGVAFRAEKTASGDYYWEWVGNQDALYTSGYSYLAPTRQDSVAGEPALHFFQVVAHTADAFRFWPSPPDSGYSVDNLAPAAPLSLMATRTTGSNVVLTWSPSGANESDFKEYWVYRSESGGVPPTPLFYLDSATDTLLTDTTAYPSQTFYYIVTAVDVHENKSVPSNEAMVNPSATGIGDATPRLTNLQVLPNVPNPFAEMTELRIGLPARTSVTLKVYDVTGRRVLERRFPSMSRGWTRIEFDGRDGADKLLTSGVYFYRISAAGMSVTKKMVVLR
jgi:hypothetical protein